MFVLDKSHKVTFWNEACRKLTGHTSEEMIGTDKHWKPFFRRKRPLLADLIMEGDSEKIHEFYDDMNLNARLTEAYFIPNDGGSNFSEWMNTGLGTNTSNFVEQAVFEFFNIRQNTLFNTNL